MNIDKRLSVGGENLNYENYANTIKALSDPRRVKILDMLSCGEMCACDILEHFEFTQPTLSHHIKVLVEAKLVEVDKRGTWHHYSINQETANKLIKDTTHLLTHTTDCVCNNVAKKEK